jgi:6,7-dimethyl-8-ribityllumazine synthase
MMSVGTYETNFAGEGLRVGIVQARFNEIVGGGCCRHAWKS